MLNSVRPGNPALTLADFAALPRGAVLSLHYHCYNRGSFVWEHDRVEGDRVFGRFCYPGETLGSVAIDGYLYEFEGVVCRGSGAEPVHLEMPETSEAEDCEECEGEW